MKNILKIYHRQLISPKSGHFNVINIISAQNGNVYSGRQSCCVYKKFKLKNKVKEIR